MNGLSEHVPGRWSSHPDALKGQRRWFVFFSLLPLAVVVVLGCWVFVDFGGWEKLLHPMTASFAGEVIWLKFTFGFVCATVAAYTTVLLMHGLAMTGDNGDGDDIPFPVWLLVLTLFSWTIPIAFYFVRRAFFVPGRFVLLNVLLNLLCIVPVAAIVLWIKAHGEKKSRNGQEPAPMRRPWGVLVLAVACTIAGIACAGATILPHRQEWMWGFAAVAAVLWITALVVWFRGAARRRREIPPVDDGNPPEWVERVRASLPDGITLEGELRRESVPDAARFDDAADPVLRLLMGGLVPTVDQSAFFRRFRDSYEDTWRGLYEQNRSMLGTVSCDVLLTGMDGSGRTEALLAAALYAALVRGENVLYVVPTQERAAALAKVVEERVAAMMLGDYVRADALCHSTMLAMMMDGSGARALPGVLFATPVQVERCFFGEVKSAGSESREMAKSIILAYSTVLVDDFCDNPMEVRIHLPFILDKWRLVLANGFVVPQFVVALSPVYRPEGAQELGRRLFGARGFSVDKTIVPLRPRAIAPYWFGTIRIGGVPDACSAVADVIRLCHDEGLKVVYYSRGMSNGEKEKILRDIARRGDCPRLISSLDEMLPGDNDADAMLHLSLTSGAAAAAMRLRVGETQAIFLRIAFDSEVNESDVRERLVPMPDETALPLRIHHLKSVLGYIPLGIPVDAAVWSRFGISMTSPMLRDGQRVDSDSVPARWFYDTWVERDYARIAPYLVLEQSAGDAASSPRIGEGAIPSPPETLWRVNRGDGAMRLLLARSDCEDSASGSLVEWRDVQGNPVGETDLAHAERMECVTDVNTFVLGKLDEAEPGEVRHSLVATCNIPRGAGLDFVFPEHGMSWNPAAIATFRCVDASRVGNVATFSLDDGQGSTIHIDCTFTGLVNLFGRRDERASRPYGYAAYVSGVVLAPNFSLSNEDEMARRLAPLAGREVSTASENYSPALTHAFTAAVKRMFEGASFFAATPAFWCDGGTDAAGRAVVWFVEPSDSGRSLFPMFCRMQGNPVFLRQFFSHVKECLENEDNVDKMRAASRFAVTGDAVSSSDRDRARKLVELLVAENEQVERMETTKRSGGNPSPRRLADEYTGEQREFDRVVVQALVDFRPEIDVTKFASEYGWDHDTICDMYFDVLWNNPQIFYVTKSAQCQWTHCGGVVTRFTISGIQYGISKDEYPTYKAELDAAVAEAMRCVAGVNDPVEVARLLHDYIVRICEYDTVAADTNDMSAKARTVYSVLVRHLALCEGYTMAYRYLLQEARVRSEEVLSENMNHCWNYVQIGDSWYHVDVTWDDPVYRGRRPSGERVSHEFFLLSDAAIRAKNHHSWDVRGLPPADDTTYDGKTWD